MYLREVCYDIDELTNANLHVHTSFSGCAKPEMRVRGIVERADELGLEMIALVDHHHRSDAPFIEKNICDRWLAEFYEAKVKILYGAELSAYGIGKRSDNPQLNAALDYRLYAANHYHLDFWEQPEDKSARGYALHTIALLTELIKSGCADCIAHPIMGGYVRCLEDKTELTKALSDNELGDLLSLARDNKVAFEINEGAAFGDEEFTRRMWNIGREAGVVFHFGTDAHTLANIDSKKSIDRLRALLK